MARSTLLLTLVALALLCTATAMRFDYTVRIMNRESGGWLGSMAPNFRIPNEIPITFTEKSNGRYSEWKVTDLDFEEHQIFNVGTGYAVAKDMRGFLTTVANPAHAYSFRIQPVDVSAYHIIDTNSELCWTLDMDVILLDQCEDGDEMQIWEFRPVEYFNDLAFWF